MKSFCLLFFALAMMLLQSCSKHEGVPTESTYTFTNTLGQRITFDVYGSDTDYYQNAHRLMRFSIPKDSGAAMALEVGRTYWVDWYNADYSRNNWQQFNTQNSQNTPFPKVSVTEYSSTVKVASTLRDTMRSILLNGGADTVSHWAGYYVAAPNDTARYWFTFSKSRTCGYRLKYGATDTIVSSPINYSVGSYRTAIDGTPTGFQLNLQTSTGQSFIFTWGQNNVLNRAINRDSLAVNYYSSSGGSTLFALRRQ